MLAGSRSLAPSVAWLDLKVSFCLSVSKRVDIPPTPLVLVPVSQ